MPSSPSMQLFRQAATLPVPQQDANHYRQTVYHDGAGLQIAETRRRSGIVRSVEMPAQAYVDFILYPGDDTPLSPRSRQNEASQHHPAPRTWTARSESDPHVTSAKRSSRLKPKPMIVQRTAGSNVQPLSDTTKIPYHTSAGPTPPPTPRLARLSTPDFSDLDEAPFCDCGIEAHVVKRCKACSKELDLWST
jgi:hypothetical protein